MVEALFFHRSPSDWSPLERAWYAYCAAGAALGIKPGEIRVTGVSRASWFAAWVALRLGDAQQFSKAVVIARGVGFVSGTATFKPRAGGCLLALDAEPVQTVQRYMSIRRSA